MEPMLATPAPARAALPHGPGWVFEVKWDGVRVLADAHDDSVRLSSRNERDVTSAYPELRGLAALGDVLLDGEVVLMEAGRPSFTALAERMHVRDTRRAAALAAARPVTYLVFDVLRHDGLDLTALPLSERRAVLDGLVLPAHVQASPWYDDGDDLWRVTAGHGLEGVVAKRRDAPYRPGRRSPDWVKAAHRRARTAVVGGWRPESTGTGRLGAVLLGAPDAAGGLRYLCRAGSGLGGPAAREMRALLAPLERATSPFRDDVPAVDARGTVWCDPVVVVEALYLARTPTGRLRQPVVRGVRTDTTADPWEQP
ncbi:DNA polymerase LigD, ligase domain protein [Cellulomonas flavigena DSM 20109]|uniref:DNA ligase (ATP) n=1 Tax=Cellulomonas flavigena (strain ATCC 482 / DSM 20109 / BCRC 11376 / JCM 18109 / NBRC 3775 / NCIMB 8073 / NRS 134) TaxID=446466 RepID=D5UEZ0_CELFN|nr:non-homologous end-joining DNA ligase [Cellulomonas flavigena]ADG74800.1 DNA polymerase LigD, ligase domain protein [Cellulomonas flavigena DSM 20109]